MTNDLPPEWGVWRVEREAEMVRFGMAREVAADVSLREARGRARAAEQVGFKAAAEAKLILTEHPDGRTTFHLALDPSAVPLARREEARRALGAVRVA